MPCPSLGDLPDPGSEPTSPPASELQADSLLLTHQYDGDLSLPLGLALGSPIFPSGCEGKLGVALESLHLGPPRGSAPGPTWKVTGCPPPLTALSLPVPPRFLSSLLTLTRQSVSRARVPPLPQPHPVTTPLQAQEHHPSFPLETPAAWHLVAPWVCISLQA